MLSRRSFIVTGICSAVSTTALGSSVKRSSTWLDTTDHDHQAQKVNTLSYKTLASHKGKALRLLDGAMPFDVKIADVHNMNSDSRLEQFSLLLETADKSRDLNGVYQAQLTSEAGVVDFPISVIGNQADSAQSKYFAVFSRIKSV